MQFIDEPGSVVKALRSQFEVVTDVGEKVANDERDDPSADRNHRE